VVELFNSKGGEISAIVAVMTGLFYGKSSGCSDALP